MSTLLSDLVDTPGQADDDFVQNILKEMNGGLDSNGPPGGPGTAVIQPTPAIGAYSQGTVINAPNPNTIAPHTMDNGPITSHMIGNSHPTSADFAQMMNTGLRGQGQGQFPVAAPGDNWGAAAAAAYAPPQYYNHPAAGGSRKKSWFAKSIEEFKPSFLVALLMFFFSLPVVNFLFAHYLPSMVKPTGDLTPIGLVVKSLAAGGAFWLLQRVIVPLLT